MKEKRIITEHESQRQHNTVQKEEIIIPVPFPILFADMKRQPENAEDNAVVFCRRCQTDTDRKHRVPEINRPLLILLPPDETPQKHNKVRHRVQKRVWPRIIQIGISIKGKHRQKESQIGIFPAVRHNLNAKINTHI